MPKRKTKVPKLRRHVKGSAIVQIDGRAVWLGRYDDPATREKYDGIIALWLANGRRLPARPALTCADSQSRCMSAGLDC